MVYRKKHNGGVYLVVAILLSSCVVSKDKYTDARNELKETQTQYDSLRKAHYKLKRKAHDCREMEAENQKLKSRVDTLNSQVTSLRKEYEDMAKNIKRLKKMNTYLKHKNHVVKYRLEKVSRIINQPIDTPGMDNTQ